MLTRKRQLIHKIGIGIADARPDLNAVISDEFILTFALFMLMGALFEEYETVEKLITDASNAALYDSQRGK